MNFVSRFSILLPLCLIAATVRAADFRSPLVSPSSPDPQVRAARDFSDPAATPEEAYARAREALETAERRVQTAKTLVAQAETAESVSKKTLREAERRLDNARSELVSAQRAWRKSLEAVQDASEDLLDAVEEKAGGETLNRLKEKVNAARETRDAKAAAVSAAQAAVSEAEAKEQQARKGFDAVVAAKESARTALETAQAERKEAERMADARERDAREAEKARIAAEKEVARQRAEAEEMREKAARAAEKALLEQERAAEKARLREAARIAEEAEKAEKARLEAEKEARKAAERAEKERLEAEKAAEKARIAEEKRLAEEARRAEEAKAAEKARKAEELARKKAEMAKIAAEKAKAEEKARLEAEKERLKAEKRAEKERLEAEKAAEKARLKEEKEAEKARIAEEKRLAKEAEEAEKARLEAEKAEKEARLAEEAATPREVALLLPPPDGKQVELSIPVPVIAVKGAIGTVSLPPHSLFRLMGNQDGTFTAFTTANDILLGKLVDSPVLPANEEGTESIRLDKVHDLTVRGADFTNPLPGEAAWRLTSGDILHGTWVRDGAADAPAAPLFAPRAADAADDVCPRRGADGRWPRKSYTVRLAANGELLEIPSSKLDAAAVGPLPPMILPAGPSVQIDEIECPGGSFSLGRQGGEGNADETPMVDIELAPFFLASTPVTKAQFRAFAEDTRYVTAAERIPGQPTWKNPGFPQGDDEPVVAVTWRDAAAYCNWRSRKARLKPAYDIREGGLKIRFDPTVDGYRLPLEAEWEWAASWGKTLMPFPWSTMEADEDWMDEAVAVGRANFAPATLALDPWPKTNPVKAFPPTGMGFYDLAGNVWEWMQDVYAEDAYGTSYRTGDVASLLNPPEDATRVRRSMRGGSYANPLPFLRCTARGYGYEQMSAPRVGFRVARKAKEIATKSGAPKNGNFLHW
jgi:formylglycine-generating enzyme required for sulfatase activity